MQQRPPHPYASLLRQRAASLRELASSIERSPVMTLGEAAGEDTWTSPQARLCERLLARNLHQLHHAADALRDTAFRIAARADELDVAHRTGHVA